MGAVVLCTFPAPTAGAENAFLDRVNRLVLRGEASLLFAGSESATVGAAPWTVAVRLRSLARASEVADAWRNDPTLAPGIRTTVLRLHPDPAIVGADLLFP